MYKARVYLNAMPNSGDEVRQVLPQRPLVYHGSRYALGHFDLGSRREVPEKSNTTSTNTRLDTTTAHIFIDDTMRHAMWTN